MNNMLSLEEKLRILVPISQKTEKGPNGELFLTISDEKLSSIDVKKAVQEFEIDSTEDGATCYYISNAILDAEAIHVSITIEKFKNWFCNRISESVNPINSIKLFLIGDAFYNKEELRKKDIFCNMIDSGNVVLALWNMADIDLGKDLILLTDKCTILEKEFKVDWIFNTFGKEKHFIDIALSNNPKDEPIKMLLKSEICSLLVNFSEEERMKKFCEQFKTIMDNFSFSLGAYMKNFTSDEIKKKYYDKVLDIEKNIKDSLGGLKTELVVFLSMYFTMCNYWNGSFPSNNLLNILIKISLWIVAITYSIVLCEDCNSLSYIITSCKDIEKEISEKNDIDNNILSEIRTRIKKKRFWAFFYKVVIGVVICASFLPPVIAICL